MKKIQIKRPEGRPTKYEPRFIESADEYLALNQDEEYDWTKADGKVQTVYEKKIKVHLPTVEGFALFLNVDKTTLYEWASKYPEFSHALRKIVEEQHKRLIDKGLSGEYNSTIAKLVLSANHNMRERQDITTNDKDLPSPILGGITK